MIFNHSHRLYNSGQSLLDGLNVGREPSRVAGDTESWAPGGFEDQGFSVGSNGFQGFSKDVAGKFNSNSFAAYVDLDLDVTSRWILSAAFPATWVQTFR